MSFGTIPLSLDDKPDGFVLLSMYEKLESENAKLRELVRLLLWGIDNDMPRYEELAWTQKVNVLVRDLGVEADE